MLTLENVRMFVFSSVKKIKKMANVSFSKRSLRTAVTIRVVNFYQHVYLSTTSRKFEAFLISQKMRWIKFYMTAVIYLLTHHWVSCNVLQYIFSIFYSEKKRTLLTSKTAHCSWVTSNLQAFDKLLWHSSSLSSLENL